MNNKPVILMSPRIEKDIHPIPSNGGGDKFFECNLLERKQLLLNNLIAVSKELSSQFAKYPDFPGVMKVTVRGDAIAKSHRPVDFLRKMNVLTYGLPTEIYVATTENNLRELILDCESRNTNKFNANVSSILTIQSFLPKDKKVILSDSCVHDIILKTFDYGSDDENAKSDIFLEKLLEKYSIESNVLKIGDKICSRTIKGVDNSTIEIIRQLPFVMSMREVASVCSPDSTELAVNAFTPVRNYLFDENNVIGIIDSGISKEAIDQKYIFGREVYIPEEYQDNNHGTFVASTILYGNEMNKRPEISPICFKILDVVALTSKDKSKGLNEDEFCECLQEVVAKYHEQVKIWNLSLAFTNTIASDEAISHVGEICDLLQKEYGVQFIIAAGNYEESPCRHWPVPVREKNDRIFSPADSVMAISVGSLAEKECPGSLSKVGEPSPFSRRGPGACSLFKPELTDFGGNMLSDFSFECVGVNVLDANSHMREQIGTSLSSPLVAYKIEKIYSSLKEKNLLLAKTLLIHDALRNSNSIIECLNEHRKYYGFGQPSNDCEYILNCKNNEITLVLECNLVNSTMVDIKDFPFPSSMISDGKCKGEIFATLVADPCLDSKYGSEYSRIDFNLSIGTFKFDDDKIEYTRQVPVIKPGSDAFRFEDQLIEEDLKWNPIKTYHRKFKEGTEQKDGWRVVVQLHARLEEQMHNHKCYVAITFVGDNDGVYDEMVESIRNQGFSMNNVETINEIRNPLKP